MDRKIIPQIELDDFTQTGWFMNELAKEGENRAPHFRCGICKKDGTLRLHSIEPNGEVNASVLCRGNCYHEFVILKDWPADLRKRAGQLFVEKV